MDELSIQQLLKDATPFFWIKTFFNKFRATNEVTTINNDGGWEIYCRGGITVKNKTFAIRILAYPGDTFDRLKHICRLLIKVGQYMDDNLFKINFPEKLKMEEEQIKIYLYDIKVHEKEREIIRCLDIYVFEGHVKDNPNDCPNNKKIKTNKMRAYVSKCRRACNLLLVNYGANSVDEIPNPFDNDNKNRLIWPETKTVDDVFAFHHWCRLSIPRRTRFFRMVTNGNRDVNLRVF